MQILGYIFLGLVGLSAGGVIALCIFDTHMNHLTGDK